LTFGSVNRIQLKFRMHAERIYSTSLFAMKGSSRKYKTEKSLTNYSLCTVRQFVFSHKTILTVIRIDNNSL